MQKIQLTTLPTLAGMNTLVHQDEWGRYDADDGKQYLFAPAPSFGGVSFTTAREYVVPGKLYDASNDNDEGVEGTLYIQATGIRQTTSAYFQAKAA